MDVKFIPGSEINSDIGVVNAARVSLDKKSDWLIEHIANTNCPYQYEDCTNQCHYFNTLKDSDTKLITYLAKHNHWTPFTHSRLYFHFDMRVFNPLDFFLNYNPGGFAHFKVENEPRLFMKGSLYSWVNNVKYLPREYQGYIRDYIHEYYPVSGNVLIPEHEYPSFESSGDILEYSEDWLALHNHWRLACATLLIKVPIFVARQIRTSQVGIAYSDMYDEPTFYTIDKWRIREGNNVKQGSTGYLEDDHNTELNSLQQRQNDLSVTLYKDGIDDKLAPEQLRSLMPQSMYTSFYMTATLHRWAQWIQLRIDPHVQQETLQVATMVRTELNKHFPKWADIYQPVYHLDF